MGNKHFAELPRRLKEVGVSVGTLATAISRSNCTGRWQ